MFKDVCRTWGGSFVEEDGKNICKVRSKEALISLTKVLPRLEETNIEILYDRPRYSESVIKTNDVFDPENDVYILTKQIKSSPAIRESVKIICEGFDGEGSVKDNTIYCKVTNVNSDMLSTMLDTIDSLTTPLSVVIDEEG